MCITVLVKTAPEFERLEKRLDRRFLKPKSSSANLRVRQVEFRDSSHAKLVLQSFCSGAVLVKIDDGQKLPWVEGMQSEQEQRRKLAL
jgi:hypothetical protein